MITVQRTQDFENLQDNKIVGTCNLNHSTIRFKGKNNILYFEEGVTLSNSNINFECNNSVVYLSKSKHNYILNLMICEESVFYVGKDNYFNGLLNINISERTNVMIGSDGLFSFDIWMRTADPHLIYDAATGKRLNPSKGIFIGDHVWIGQRAMILKGTKIGSGSIIGAMSLVSGKTIPSNESWAGVPAHMVKNNIFFNGACVHKYTEEMTLASQMNHSTQYIYEENGGNLNFDVLDREVSRLKESSGKLDYVINTIVNHNEKNKFFISGAAQKISLTGRIKNRLKRIFAISQ